jgi:hypothetical protein
VLDRELTALRHCRSDGKQRERTDVLDTRPHRHSLEQARHICDLDAELLAPTHQPEQYFVWRLRERDDNLADTLFVDHPLDVPARAEHRQRQGLALADEGLLVEEPDRLEAELRPRLEPPGGELTDLAGADDERRAQPDAAYARR